MKVIYLNKETGKEVKYGENITYTTKQELKNGYKIESTITMPLINETIPTLIEQGVLVQKEVNDKPGFKPGKKKGKHVADSEEYTVDEKLEMLRAAVGILFAEVESIKADIYEEDDDE